MRKLLNLMEAKINPTLNNPWLSIDEVENFARNHFRLLDVNDPDPEEFVSSGSSSDNMGNVHEMPNAVALWWD